MTDHKPPEIRPNPKPTDAERSLGLPDQAERRDRTWWSKLLEIVDKLFRGGR